MLSQSAWRNYFHSDSAVLGQIVTIGHEQVRIAVIASAGSGRMPGNPDLWILESDATLARNAARAGGYVVARLTATGQAQMIGDFMPITATAPSGAEIDLQGRAFDAPASGTVSIYLFALFLAVLALPAITSVSKSESNFSSHPPSFKTRVRRWSFFAAKISLIGLIAYFSSIDIAYVPFPNYSPIAEFLQFLFGFTLSLFGLRWAMIDQSHRCPVCLRRVTHPAQVGVASCNFLSWNGTEMICMGGHALLHVPSLPTSWFSVQRWTYLDTSWDFLFVDSHPQW